MKRVVIIGGGFAGLSAARRLHRRGGAQVMLLDPRATSQFLPLLPDVIGRWLPPRSVQYPLATAARRWGFRWVRERAEHIDVQAGRVATARGRFEYDALIVATGEVTNFHGSEKPRRFSQVIETVEDALAIRRLGLDRDHHSIVIAGGGYTGVEVATQLWRLLRLRGRSKRLVIVDPAEEMCPVVPKPFRPYVRKNVERLGIEVHLETTGEPLGGGVVELSNGERVENCGMVWAAGVRTPDLVQELDCEKAHGGRVIVNDRLQAKENVFFAGDAAAFMQDGQPLRQSVQFSLLEGDRAGENAALLLQGRKPKLFRPLDLGYVVPMANFRGCGTVLGLPVRGWVPAFLHYVMSLYRTWGLGSRSELLAALLTRGQRQVEGPPQKP
ncbi:MAG: NAD(P)/FAD-dependent oxidoreductase [Phycisphaerae bacterium]